MSKIIDKLKENQFQTIEKSNVSETDWTSEQDYKLVDGSWNVC